MPFSRFAQRLGPASGIVSLMDDLGNALTAGGPELRMLGGGNPAHIPEVQAVCRRHLQALAEDPDRFARLVGDYDPPAGHPGFRAAIADLFRQEYGWPITPEHVALTNGSQAGFFLLFNILAGTQLNGGHKRICFPLAPEYIGYADLGLSQDMLVAHKPVIDYLEDQQFKYRVDFAHLNLDETVAAVCVSRPTNPTGNVLSDTELRELLRLTKHASVPLIIDGAYGTPFPNILFTPAEPMWDEHVIACFSLSKLGLPACRTGIIIANPAVIAAVAAANTISCLATGSVGAGIGEELVRSREILRLSRELVQPFYQQRVERALDGMCDGLQGLPCRIHKPEGALFLWLWCPGLPISSHELYQRLKKRQVLVVPGEHFFAGLPDQQWSHRRECLRISYAMDERQVAAGLQIVAEEVRRAYESA